MNGNNFRRNIGLDKPKNDKVSTEGIQKEIEKMVDDTPKKINIDLDNNNSSRRATKSPNTNSSLNTPSSRERNIPSRKIANDNVTNNNIDNINSARSKNAVPSSRTNRINSNSNGLISEADSESLEENTEGIESEEQASLDATADANAVAGTIPDDYLDEEEDDDEEEGAKGFPIEISPVKLLFKKLLRSPYFWLAVVIIIVLILLIALLYVLFMHQRFQITQSVLCGGETSFDNVKVITTNKENQPLDTWNFYDYIKGVMYAEYSINESSIDDANFITHQAAYEAFAIAAASYAIRNGHYYDQERNHRYFESWCDDDDDYYQINGVNVYKCPKNITSEDKIIVIQNNTNNQNACDIYLGCIQYELSGNTNGGKAFKKSNISTFSAPSSIGEYTKTETRRPVSSPIVFEYIIQRTKGVFLSNQSGTITGFAGYRSGASNEPCAAGNDNQQVNKMCAGKRDEPFNINKQAEAGWGALKILAYWYPSAYFTSKSPEGIYECEKYANLASTVKKLPMLNWKDDGTNNFVADSSFKMGNFLASKPETNLTVGRFNNLLKTAAVGRGLGSRYAAAEVAGTYINTLALLGVRGSYEWGGKYAGYGLKNDLAEPVNGERKQQAAILPSSFDCTGFVDWVIHNSGLGYQSNYHKRVTSRYPDGGMPYDEIYQTIGEIGDVLEYSNGNPYEGHVRLIIGHEFDSNGVCQTNVYAESSGGISITSYSVSKSMQNSKKVGYYSIINMNSCYRGITCTKVSEDEFYNGVDIGKEDYNG